MIFSSNGLRFPKHAKEYGDAQRRKRIDQCRKQDNRSHKTPQHTHYAENQIPYQEGRYQHHSYKSEERSSLERHDQSMARPLAMCKSEGCAELYTGMACIRS